MYSNGSALSILGHIRTDVTRSTSKIVLSVKSRVLHQAFKCHAALHDKCMELNAGGM